MPPAHATQRAGTAKGGTAGGPADGGATGGRRARRARRLTKAWEPAALAAVRTGGVRPAASGIRTTAAVATASVVLRVSRPYPLNGTMPPT